MPEPSIDIVIPNYNYGRYLRGCTDSVLGQKGVRLRILIIDNASSDDSPAIARAIAALDKRVALQLRAENLGPHASFNAGIDWAQSDYFLILCSDDLLAPDALQRGVAILEQHHDTHLAYGRTRTIDGAVEVAEGLAQAPADWQIHSGREFIGFCCRHAFNPVPGPTAIVRTAIQKSVGHYRQSLSHTDDLEMWLRVADRGNIASTSATQALARVHPHNQSSSVAGTLQWNGEFEKGFRSFFAHEGADYREKQQLLKAMELCLGKRVFWSAISNMLRGDVEAGQLLKQAIRRKPSMLLVPPVDYLLARSERRSQRPRPLN